MEKELATGIARLHSTSPSEEPDPASLAAMDEPDDDDVSDLEKGVPSGELAYFLQMRQKYPKLSHREFLILHAKFMQGSERAGDILMCSNVGLAIQHALRSRGRGVEVADLIQEALLAIRLKALPKFEPERGYRFSTYCMYWVRQAIQRAIQDKRTDGIGRVPVHWQERKALIGRVRSTYYKLNGSWPDADLTHELIQKIEKAGAKATQLKHIEQYLKSAPSTPLSLDMPVSDDGDTTLHQRIADISGSVEDRYGAEQAMAQLTEQVKHEVQRLSRKEAQLVNFRFGLFGGEPESLRQIGIRFGVTRERIRQIESTILQTLARRLKINEETIRDLLEAVGEAQQRNYVIPQDTIADPRYTDILGAFEILCEHACIGHRRTRVVPRPVRTLHIRTERPESWTSKVVSTLVEQGWVTWIPDTDAVELLREAPAKPEQLKSESGPVKAAAIVPKLTTVALTSERIMDELTHACVTIRGKRVVRGAIPLLSYIGRQPPKKVIELLNVLIEKGCISSIDDGRVILLEESLPPQIVEREPYLPSIAPRSHARSAAQLTVAIHAGFDALERALRGTT